MRSGLLPIIIGCYDKPDKCAVLAKDDKYGGYSLLICRLKNSDGIRWGDTPDMDNIEKVICHLHFCKLEAAKAFLKALQTMVDKWQAENA